MDRDFTTIRDHLDEPAISAAYSEGQALTMAEAITSIGPYRSVINDGY